jgi:hypothetical protein
VALMLNTVLNSLVTNVIDLIVGYLYWAADDYVKKNEWGGMSE